MNPLTRTCAKLAACGGRPIHLSDALSRVATLVLCALVFTLGSDSQTTPPRVRQAERFLARRGVAGWRTAGAWKARSGQVRLAASPLSSSSAIWEPLGPMQVLSINYGLVTGRISSLALDPSDSTGNTLLVGTTGGGVWLSQNAGTSDVANVVFTPLTDSTGAMSGAEDSSISIGAVTVQPGGTGVILAGAGDPNDALDSYYGAGLLRSGDGGNTWTLILGTSDVAAGLARVEHGFLGEGFAGFAWSTPPSNPRIPPLNPQVVVAAVSQARVGEFVDADLSGYSYAGLYYSIDSGATWHLATITDGNGHDVQGPLDDWAGTDGNAATAVVWNPARGLFVAAVRFHGYYQSPDGVTWTRMTAQPGTGLTTQMCPTDTSMTGSPACPIFRGALAVNPETGDTFAWTVALDQQDPYRWPDQGLWQDVCNPSAGACASQSIAFGKQWSTAKLEVPGTVNVANGDYNLTLAAVPSGQDTLLLAGANDLWKCSLANGCNWRNTTNSTGCMSAQVGEYQHAIEWDSANPLEIFVGNDSGLWRSEDAIGETGLPCSPDDASHWQNLNGGLGSLAEVESLAGVALTPYTMMAGLGANGTAGIKGASKPVQQWPEILSGEGGPVAIDSTDNKNWYANNGAGVSIYLCVQSGDCSAADFGPLPVVNDADTGNDGLTMTAPAPFLVDPADPSQLLIATCRLWRGPASGKGWTAANAITPILGGGSDCGSSPLIRSLAAAALSGGGEVVYAGTYGSLNGGGNMGGYVLSTTMDSSGTWSGWQDLTQNPVGNDTVAFNAYNLDVAGLTIDPHDPAAETVYATIAGIPNRNLDIRTVYRLAESIEGKANWTQILSNLFYAPANALVVDPVDANTVYVATDGGVFATRQVTTCGTTGVSCWAAYGSGLPDAPVTTLLATQPSASLNVLVAGTYGRGIWQIPLLTAGQQMTSASVNPSSLSFGSQGENTTSVAQTVTLTNSGGIALVATSFTTSGDFTVSDPNNCTGAVINASQGCAVQVAFSPAALGSRSGQLVIEGNIASGNITVDLSGTGVPPPAVTLSPQAIDFGEVESGTTSATLQVTAANGGGVAAAVSSVAVTGPFALTGNACGTSLAPDSDCQLTVQFRPTSSSPATGKLTMVDDSGTQTVLLSGTGTAPPTDTLAPGALSFSGTTIGVASAAQAVTLSNSGGNPLTSIAISTGGPFQQSNNCTTQLTGPASCTFGVVFLPTASGQQTGTLTVADILRTQTVTLTGIGVNPPAFTVIPPSVTFSGIQPGATSAAKTLTVTNSGGAVMAHVGLQIGGSGASAFSTSANTCGASLGAGGSCTVQVVFTAPASVTANASLILSTSTRGPKNSAITATVPLNGNSVASGALEAAPAQIDFPTTGVGQTSDPVAVTLTNLNTSASFNSLAVTPSAQFQVSSSNCGVSLAAGASCTVNVVFAPGGAGAQAGALTVFSPGLSAPVTVPLTGTGFDFAPTISGSGSQTVSSGETATYALTLTPGSEDATFSFHCTSVPDHASCGFNPNALSVAANTSGTETVQIATGQSSAAVRQPGRPGIAPVLLACGVLLLWPAARRRARAWIVLILLAVMFVVAGAGCSGSGGGGGGTAGGSGTTPPGSYTVQVTASCDKVQHSVTLTLVID